MRKKIFFASLSSIVTFVALLSVHSTNMVSANPLFVSNDAPNPNVFFGPATQGNYVTGRGPRIQCNLFANRPAGAGNSQDARCTDANSAINGVFDLGFRNNNGGANMNIPVYIPKGQGVTQFRFKVSNPGVCVKDSGYETARTQLNGRVDFPATGSSGGIDRFQYSQETGGAFDDRRYRTDRDLGRLRKIYDNISVSYVFYNPSSGAVLYDSGNVHDQCSELQSIVIPVSPDSLSTTLTYNGTAYARYTIRTTTNLPYISRTFTTPTRGGAWSDYQNRPSDEELFTNDIDLYNSFQVKTDLINGVTSRGFFGANAEANSWNGVIDQSSPITTSSAYTSKFQDDAYQVNNYNVSTPNKTWSIRIPFGVTQANRNDVRIGFVDMDLQSNAAQANIRSYNPCTGLFSSISPPPDFQGSNDPAWQGPAELGNDRRRLRNYIGPLSPGIYVLEVTGLNNSNNIGVRLPQFSNLFSQPALNCENSTAAVAVQCAANGNIRIAGAVRDSDTATAKRISLSLTKNNTVVAPVSGNAYPTATQASPAADGTYPFSWISTAGSARYGPGNYQVTLTYYEYFQDGSTPTSKTTTSSVTCTAVGGAFTVDCGSISSDFGNLEPGQTITSFPLNHQIRNDSSQIVTGSIQVTFDANGPPPGMSPISITVNLAPGASQPAGPSFANVQAPNSARMMTLTFVGTPPVNPSNQLTDSCPLTAATRTYFRVEGGDVATRQNIYTFGRSDTAAEYYGAGSDYAAFSDRNIDGSLGDTSNREAFFSRMIGARNNRDISRSLMFANTASSPPLGGQFAGVPSISVPNITGYTQRPCSPTLSGIVVGINEKIAYNCPGQDVILMGPTPIQFAYNSGTALESIPSVKIIAGNIFINDDVTTLNGEFYASGKFSTCGSGGIDPTMPNSSQINRLCSRQLLIYGSVSAGSVELRRTIGTVQDAVGNEQGNAAERFIFSPELFSGAASPGNTSAIYYEDLTNLPPIY